MGAPTVSPYDIYLGDASNLVGYRTRQFVRDSAPLVAPRFSTGQQGQTDLDLLKSVSVDDFRGGMFMADWTDPTKVSHLIGRYNPYNHYVYPTIPPAGVTTVPTGTVNAKCESYSYSFIATSYMSSGVTYNFLHKVTYGSPTPTAITLPAALSTVNNAVSQISSMAVHKNYLYVSCQYEGGTVTCHRYNITTPGWQDIGGNGNCFFELRGVLYIMSMDGSIFSCTNEFAAGAATYTLIDQAGVADAASAYQISAVEFNGAVWITKKEGIFRFDGLKAVKVLSLSAWDMTVFNGALYFFAGDWLYKFDGTNVTQLQFFGSGETIFKNSMSADANYLYFQTVVLPGYASGDKFPLFSSFVRLYTYDGVAISLMDERSTTTTSVNSQAIVITQGYLYSLYAYFDTSQWFPSCVRYPLLNNYKPASVTTSSKLEFTTSEFDAGFPNVYKSANLFELSYIGMITGDSLAVSYQTFDGQVWSASIALGTLTSTTPNRLEITDKTKMLFKRIRFTVVSTLAAGSTFALKGCSLRWTLQPRMRWRWQLSVASYGTSLITRLGAATTTSANSLNNLITQSVKQKTPIYLLSPDYTVVKTTTTAISTTIVLQGEFPIYTDPYGEYPLIAITNDSGAWELLRVLTSTYTSATDQTTITVAERGYLGITAAAITAGKLVHLCYRTYVTRLIRDSAELDDETYDEQSTAASQLKREFTLELTEV